jgi:hypothetical protein
MLEKRGNCLKKIGILFFMPGAIVLALMMLLPMSALATSTNALTSRRSMPKINRVHYLRPSSYAAGDASHNLAYNNGPVMAGTAKVYVIFWEPQESFVSSHYNSLILRYFRDVGGTGLYNNNIQYNDTAGAAPDSARLAGSWVDASPYPSSTLQDSNVQAEVSRAQSTNGWAAAITHVFFVFTAQNEVICSGPACSFTTFCGYHSAFGSNSIYAAVPYVSGVQGCETPSSPNHDDADSAINIASHEQMEAATDPLLNAWTDSTGMEIGDKCAFNFAATRSNGADINWDGDPYIVQKEWDNTRGACAIKGP